MKNLPGFRAIMNAFIVMSCLLIFIGLEQVISFTYAGIGAGTTYVYAVVILNFVLTECKKHDKSNSINGHASEMGEVRENEKRG